MSTILVISQDAEQVVKVCQGALKAFKDKFDLKVVDCGLDGLAIVSSSCPILTIIDNDLPDIPGMTIASIIKDAARLHNPSVFLYNLQKMYPNTKADSYFFKPLDIGLFTDNLFDFLEFKFCGTLSRGALEKAIIEQASRIPKNISTEAFSVSSIYSPYKLLSGDGLDYWYDKLNNTLYGYLFDCTGHDFNSYIMASMDIMPMIESSFRLYEAGAYDSLSEFMSSLNDYLMSVHTDIEPTPMILFFADFNNNTLNYCIAGVENILIKQRGSDYTQVIDIDNPILGSKVNAEFNEAKIAINSLSQIIFASDGLLDALHSNSTDICDILQTAKHDDVSAIIINFKDAHNGHPKEE